MTSLRFAHQFSNFSTFQMGFYYELWPFTVVKNGKFSTIIPYDDKRVRLCHCCIPFNFLDFKDLKKLKKANEGRKGQMKGQNI